MNMIEPLRRAFEAGKNDESPSVQLGGGVLHVWDDVGLDSFEAFLNSGTYGTPEKYWPPEFRIAFDVRDIDGLTVDGQGATLMMHGFTQPFQFINCNKLIVKNLTIDWERPPYSVATVVSCQRAELTVSVWSDFPWNDAMPIHTIGEYDPSLLHTDREYAAVGARRISERDVVITLGREASIRPGQILIVRHTTCCFWGIDCLRCSNVEMRNVTLHATPGIGMMIRQCSDVAFDAVSIIPRPNSQRLMSTNHDAIMVTGCSGSVEYRNCRFEGMGDDAIGTGSPPRYRFLEKRGRSLRALFENIDDYHNVPHAVAPEVGSSLELIHIGAGVLQIAEITSSKFDFNTGILEAELAEIVDDRIAEGDFLVEYDRHTEASVSRCVFMPNRSRGVMIGRACAVTIEDSIFYKTGGSGIFCFQGYGGDNIGPIAIRRNTFIDCGDGVANMGAHGIYIEDHWFELPEDVEGGRPYYRSVSIEDNTFYGDNGPAVMVKGCIEVRVFGNRFVTETADPVRYENCARIESDRRPLSDIVGTTRSVICR